MTDLVGYCVEDGVARLQLNRPEAANALNLELARALQQAVDRAAADDDVRALLVIGSGERFCAGGDVQSFVAADVPADYLHQLATEGDVAIRTLGELDKPVVARVQGAVAGAGLGLMLSCDLIVADPATRFVFAYPAIGLTPDCGVSSLLPRAIGQQRALAFALSGRAATAEEALAWGLVTEVSVTSDERAAELAAALAHGAARALGRTRALLRGGWEYDRATVGVREAQVIGEMVDGDEAQALIQRFLTR